MPKLARRALPLVYALFVCVGLVSQAHSNDNTASEFSDAIIDIENRIIGGRVVDSNEYPWMVALVYNDARSLVNRQFCGGTLIASRWVLTAAHCMFDARGSELTNSSLLVATGVNNLQTDTPTEVADVTNIIVHPSYDHFATNPLHDIALLELAIDTTVGVVELSKSAPNTWYNEIATVMGWGAIFLSDSGEGVYPVHLNEVDVPVVSLASCNAPNSYNGMLLETQLCAGLAAGGKDSCIGDSGGPLVINSNGQWLQIGIVSFGNGCAQENFYGVYTSVAHYINWINDYVSVGSNSLSSANVGLRSSGSSAGQLNWPLLSFMLLVLCVRVRRR